MMCKLKGGNWLRGEKAGFMTLELLTGIVVIIIPVMVAIAEVYRVEWAACRVITSAQKDCIQSAVRQNHGHNYQVITIQAEEDVPVLRATQRIFPDWRPRSIHLEREYWIGTGTGKGIRI